MARWNNWENYEFVHASNPKLNVNSTKMYSLVGVQSYVYVICHWHSDMKRQNYEIQITPITILFLFPGLLFASCRHCMHTRMHTHICTHMHTHTEPGQTNHHILPLDLWDYFKVVQSKHSFQQWYVNRSWQGSSPVVGHCNRPVKLQLGETCHSREIERGEVKSPKAWASRSACWGPWLLFSVPVSLPQFLFP